MTSDVSGPSHAPGHSDSSGGKVAPLPSTTGAVDSSSLTPPAPTPPGAAMDNSHSGWTSNDIAQAQFLTPDGADGVEGVVIYMLLYSGAGRMCEDPKNLIVTTVCSTDADGKAGFGNANYTNPNFPTNCHVVFLVPPHQGASGENVLNAMYSGRFSFDVQGRNLLSMFKNNQPMYFRLQQGTFGHRQKAPSAVAMIHDLVWKMLGAL